MSNVRPIAPAQSHETKLSQLIWNISCVVLIFVFIQAMNQFLILTGSRLERALAGQPNRRFVVGVFQQITQASLGIGIYRLIFRQGIGEMGLSLRNSALSTKLFSYFALTWSTIIILYCVAAYFFWPDTWVAMNAIDLPPANQIVTTLVFQSFFPGFGEEILFRGLFLSLLAAFVFPNCREKRRSRVGVVVVSSLYFALAHIYFMFNPLRLTHIDAVQLLTAFVCGAFYAEATLRTKSLLAPFLAHNFSNTSVTLCSYIISLW
jgi:membrane protease YdiL (CAAX protease family)